MLIGSLATAKWPYNETSTNSSRLSDVSLLTACSLIMNVLAVFNFQEQEQKLSIYFKVRTETLICKL